MFFFLVVNYGRRNPVLHFEDHAYEMNRLLQILSALFQPETRQVFYRFTFAKLKLVKVTILGGLDDKSLVVTAAVLFCTQNFRSLIQHSLPPPLKFQTLVQSRVLYTDILHVLPSSLI